MATCSSTYESSYFFSKLDEYRKLFRACFKQEIYLGYLYKRKTFLIKCVVCVSPRFSWLNYFKDFNFLMQYSLLGDLPERLLYSTTPIYYDNLKKRFHLKDTTKNSINTMDISSLINTDPDNLNNFPCIILFISF